MISYFPARVALSQITNARYMECDHEPFIVVLPIEGMCFFPARNLTRLRISRTTFVRSLSSVYSKIFFQARDKMREQIECCHYIVSL